MALDIPKCSFLNLYLCAGDLAIMTPQKQLADTFLKSAPPGLFGGVVSAFLYAIFAATISLTSSILLRSSKSDELYFHTTLAISRDEISRLRPWSDLSRVR